MSLAIIVNNYFSRICKKFGSDVNVTYSFTKGYNVAGPFSICHSCIWRSCIFNPYPAGTGSDKPLPPVYIHAARPGSALLDDQLSRVFSDVPKNDNG